MPLLPTDAASTAAPVPPKTSQKVPKNSATAALPVFMCPPPRQELSTIEAVEYPAGRDSYPCGVA